MEKFALALCGGGGKGSYQIGIWKALKEKNMIDNMTAISGTSVGALNAVLFALGDLDKAEQMWKSINSKQMLQINSEDLLKTLKESDLFKGDFSKKIKDHSFITELKDSVLNEVEKKGVFKNEEIGELFEGLDLSKLKNSIPVYINCYNATDNKTESVLLNDLDKDTIIKYLLASSAFPIAFGMIDISGKKYQDGGFTGSYLDQIINDGILKNVYIGNVPIDILYQKGYKNIMIASLNHNFSIYDIYDINGLKIDIEKRYPKAKFNIIAPNGPMGSAFNLNGILDFSPKGIKDRMEVGYNDAIDMKADIGEILSDIIKDKFHSAKDIENFIKQEHAGIINIPLKTFGGMTWYTTICTLYGWKLQQHKVIRSHYRILDPDNVRRAWVLDPNTLIKSLNNKNISK